MSLSLPWSSHTHLLLDIRTTGVMAEFVRRERDGKTVSIAKTTLTSTSGTITPQFLTSQCKEIRTKYPQLQPQSVLVFLHAPLIVSEHVCVDKKVGEQTITAAFIAALVDSADTTTKEKQKDTVLVHEYVQHYTVNGYRVQDPRGKVGSECGVCITKSYVTRDVQKDVLGTLEQIWGTPVRACSWTEALSHMVLRETDGPVDFVLLDIGATESEFTRVSSASTMASMCILHGMADVYTTIQETTEMKREEIQNAVPLLASKTLEESLAKRLSQGVVSAAKELEKTVLSGALGDVKPILPVLCSFGEGDAALGGLLVTSMPFSTILPPGDMGTMAAMVGL